MVRLVLALAPYFSNFSRLEHPTFELTSLFLPTSLAYTCLHGNKLFQNPELLRTNGITHIFNAAEGNGVVMVPKPSSEVLDGKLDHDL